MDLTKMFDSEMAKFNRNVLNLFKAIIGAIVVTFILFLVLEEYKNFILYSLFFIVATICIYNINQKEDKNKGIYEKICNFYESNHFDRFYIYILGNISDDAFFNSNKYKLIKLLKSLYPYTLIEKDGKIVFENEELTKFAYELQKEQYKNSKIVDFQAGKLILRLKSGEFKEVETSLITKDMKDVN